MAGGNLHGGLNDNGSARTSSFDSGPYEELPDKRTSHRTELYSNSVNEMKDMLCKLRNKGTDQQAGGGGNPREYISSVYEQEGMTDDAPIQQFQHVQQTANPFHATGRFGTHRGHNIMQPFR